MTPGELQRELAVVNRALAKASIEAYEAWKARFVNTPSSIEERKKATDVLAAAESAVSTLETHQKMVSRAIHYNGSAAAIEATLKPEEAQPVPQDTSDAQQALADAEALTDMVDKKIATRTKTLRGRVAKTQ